MPTPAMPRTGRGEASKSRCRLSRERYRGYFDRSIQGEGCCRTRLAVKSARGCRIRTTGDEYTAAPKPRVFTAHRARQRPRRARHIFLATSVCAVARRPKGPPEIKLRRYFAPREVPPSRRMHRCRARNIDRESHGTRARNSVKSITFLPAVKMTINRTPETRALIGGRAR